MKVSKDNNNPALTLNVEVGEQSTRPGETVMLNVILRNTGAAPLLVNGRMLLNSEKSPENSRELIMRIDGPPGYFNLTRFSIRSGPPTKEFFVELGPAEEIRKSFEISRLNSLHQPGEYRIQVIYNNVHAYRVGNQVAWTGSLMSKPISIERLQD